MASVVTIPGTNSKLDTKEDVASILTSIEECEGLTVLQLSGNSFGVEAMEAIGRALTSKPQLSRALWSDMFVSRLKTEIPQALISLGDGVMAAHSCLTELDLSDNAFGPAGVEALIGFLTSPSCFTLKVLRFNNNGLGSNGGILLSKGLRSCHEEAKKTGQRLALEVFEAGRNRLENVGATALAEFFEVLETLVEVSLPQNGINAEGVCALAKAFSKNPNLRKIDLNDNTVIEAGSVALAEVLPNLQKVTIVNLGDCLVRNGGAEAIAKVIKNGHKLLQELNLSFCELEGDVGLTIADSLSNKEELKKIDLNGNNFGREGIQLLTESLEAKGLADVLGSFDEDEGLTEDEGSTDNEDSMNRQGEESEDKEVEPDEEKEGNLSTDEKLHVRGVSISPVGTVNSRDDGTQPVISISPVLDRPGMAQDPLQKYLTSPTADNLISLGENRVQLLVDCLQEGCGGAPSDTGEDREEGCQGTPSDTGEDREAAVAAMYVKVASVYVEDCQPTVQRAVESVIDALLEPLFEDGAVNLLLNEILVQIGLIKSEDKKFKPVVDVEGALLALKYVVKQDYFLIPSACMLIEFLNKESPVLDEMVSRSIVDNLLQVLHTL